LQLANNLCSSTQKKRDKDIQEEMVENIEIKKGRGLPERG